MASPRTPNSSVRLRTIRTPACPLRAFCRLECGETAPSKVQFAKARNRLRHRMKPLPVGCGSESAPRAFINSDVPEGHVGLLARAARKSALVFTRPIHTVFQQHSRRQWFASKLLP